jgi:hypothetical protein
MALAAVPAAGKVEVKAVSRLDSRAFGLATINLLSPVPGLSSATPTSVELARPPRCSP